MNRSLARYLTILIVNDIDKRLTQGMLVSSYEAEQLEGMFVKRNFGDIEMYLNNKFKHERKIKEEDMEQFG